MTKIEWTDETWNPVTGCDKVSQGCKNCYAEIMHRRLMGMFPDKYSKPFLGNIQLHPDELSKVDQWTKPRMVFVNSMSDLFHPDVPFGFIDKVYHKMWNNPQHTFQILTKRNGPFWLRSSKHFIIDIDGRGHLYRDMFDWNEEAQKREDELNITKQSNAWWMANTGKSKSGNALDGNQYLEFPQTKHV